MGPIRAMFLPGAVLPAQPAYGALIEALGPDVDAAAKDLELYAGGGAASLAFAARHPERLLSLSLFEPAWAGPGIEARHHFDPPHRIEPERLAGLLREHWDRAESKRHADLR